MSSGSVINLTAGILFRMRNTSCWTVRMNILSAFALSTSLSSHLSMGSFGSGWRHLQLSHAGAIYNWHTLEPFQELGLGSQKLLKNCFQASCSFCRLRCQTRPYQTCPFQHYYQLSSGDNFRSSLQPS